MNSNSNYLYKTKMRQKSCLILMTILYNLIVSPAMSKVIETSDAASVAGLPLDISLLQNLAEEVCSNLFLDEKITNEECTQRFIKPTKDLLIDKNAAQVKIICQEEKSVKLAFAPSSSFNQLVVLIPKDTDNYFVEFKMSDLEETIQKVTLQNTSYKIYSTVIDNSGDRSDWIVGPVIPRVRIVDSESLPKEINISKMGDYVYKEQAKEEDNENVQTTFFWKSFINECSFFVYNYCLHEGEPTQREINGGDIDERKSIMFDLPLGDECTIKIYGPTRNGSLSYRTPDCVKRKDGKLVCKTENIKNLTISVQTAKIEGWDVTVNWGKPNQHPKLYNITLRYGKENIKQVLAGTARQAKFHNIVGSGVFEVTVMAVYNKATTVANQRGRFPNLTWSETDAAACATAGALLLALLATALVVTRRQLRNRRVRLYFPDLEEIDRKDSIEEGWSVSVGEDAWELRPDRLVLQQVLGEGAFGVVRRASLSPGGVLVAVKMLKEFPSVEEVRSFRAEMELMKSVGGHAHVVSLVGCCSGRRPAIVAEYCSRGDLLNYLRSAWNIMVTKRNEKYYNNNDYNPNYREEPQQHSATIFVNKLYDLQGVCDSELTAVELLSFCRQVAMGMEFLASNRVVHRDLAARNILVSEDKTLKIADFGLSRDVYQDNLYKQRGDGKLPIKWMAIESLTHRLFTTQSDVWSFGVVMWEVVTVGGAPYPGVAAARLPRLLRAGYRMPPPTNCTQPLYEIMTSCWNSRPRERPSFSELHAKLDALLHNASAGDYLTVQIDYEDHAPIKQSKYKALLARSKLTRWAVRESYECPLKPATDNHYISSPDIVRTQALPA